MNTNQKLRGKILLLTCAISTIAIAPFSNFEPVNLPKMVALSVGTLSALFLLKFSRNIRHQVRFLFTLKYLPQLLLFGTLVIISNSILKSDLDFAPLIWGAPGRSTGALTIVLLVILFVLFSVHEEPDILDRLLTCFLRTSFLVTWYGVVQFLELDPVSWQGKDIFSFLGNINFSSGIWGLASSLMVAKILDPRLELSKKLFYVPHILINVFLIWESGSLQGLVIFGLCSVQIVVLVSSQIRKIPYLSLILLLGLYLSLTLSIIGTLGKGPFGKYFLQDTMIYRTDYWRAGISMVQASPLSGLGPDAFGSYYREYRDEVAVIRTGANRTSDTAHNIFIDYASGSGILLAIVLLSVFIVGIWSAYRLVISSNFSSTYVAGLSLLIGFFIYCLISINQIGVMVWFWAIAGAVISCSNSNMGQVQTLRKVKLNHNEREKKRSSHSISTQAISSRERYLQDSNNSPYFITKAGIGAILGIAITFPPLAADSRFYFAWQDSNLTAMSLIAEEFGSTRFQYEKVLESSFKRQDGKLSLVIAQNLVKKYPRSVFGWETIADLAVTSEDLRKVANMRLQELDPFNPDYKM